MAFAATVVTWFVAQALLDVASPLGPRLEGITGFLAIVVLLIVLNSFVHKVYWSDWIGRHHRQRRRLLAQTGITATIGLIAFGFTSVFREGLEVVLFLQNLQPHQGTGTVLDGVVIGLALTAAVGVVTSGSITGCPTRGAGVPGRAAAGRRHGRAPVRAGSDRRSGCGSRRRSP